MMKWFKRIFGTKRSLTWLINTLLKIAFIFYKFYTKEPIDLYDLIFLSLLEASTLIVLGLIEFEDIVKIAKEYKK